MIPTKNDLKKATKQELLQAVNEALEAGSTDKFQTTFGTDYSYTTLRTACEKAGLRQGWYDPELVSSTSSLRIVIDSDEPKERYNLNLIKSTKEKYERFLKGKSYPFKHTSAALEMYMGAVQDGTVDVTMK